ncbi:SapC family protein [Paraglaciecola polaris]|uniref:SapC family protein n=1 Tax=Paraglaciecola polaris TaxID=222814 RepID=UPI0030EE600E|tara:strand:+ start:5698 stop:6432 length:735 start_codon:yes stop_codon:yes gene_type:complete
MANHVLLNNIEHSDLRVITQRGDEFGDNLWFSPTFVDEMRSVQAHYPIVFHKDQNTAQFTPVALFGFQQQENLFLQSSEWDATYIPLSVQRMPFFIGRQDITTDGVTEQQRVITLDTDSPRVSKTQGVELFLEYGGNSQYLEDIAAMLETLHHGLQDNEAFVNTLISLNLLESMTLDVTLDNGANHQLIGFYTINEDVLNNLSPDNIVQLHNAGYLQAAYLILASQVHFNDLVALKNKRVARGQ